MVDPSQAPLRLSADTSDDACARACGDGAPPFCAPYCIYSALRLRASRLCRDIRANDCVMAAPASAGGSVWAPLLGDAASPPDDYDDVESLLSDAPEDRGAAIAPGRRARRTGSAAMGVAGDRLRRVRAPPRDPPAPLPQLAHLRRGGRRRPCRRRGRLRPSVPHTHLATTRRRQHSQRRRGLRAPPRAPPLPPCPADTPRVPSAACGTTRGRRAPA